MLTLLLYPWTNTFVINFNILIGAKLTESPVRVERSLNGDVVIGANNNSTTYQIKQIPTETKMGVVIKARFGHYLNIAMSTVPGLRSTLAKSTLLNADIISTESMISTLGRDLSISANVGWSSVFYGDVSRSVALDATIKSTFSLNGQLILSNALPINTISVYGGVVGLLSKQDTISNLLSIKQLFLGQVKGSPLASGTISTGTAEKPSISETHAISSTFKTVLNNNVIARNEVTVKSTLSEKASSTATIILNKITKGRFSEISLLHSTVVKQSIKLSSVISSRHDLDSKLVTDNSAGVIVLGVGRYRLVLDNVFTETTIKPHASLIEASGYGYVLYFKQPFVRNPKTSFKLR